MRPYPWKCATCHERAVVGVRLPRYEANLDHDGRSYEVVVENLDVHRCEACGTIMLDDVAGDRLSEGLRQAVGLLSPTAIRSGREALGLTQRSLAAWLRISESTLSRWETGAQIQQRSMDAFLRVVFQFSEVRSYLGGLAAPVGTVATLQSACLATLPTELRVPYELSVATCAHDAKDREVGPPRPRDAKLELVA